MKFIQSSDGAVISSIDYDPSSINVKFATSQIMGETKYAVAEWTDNPSSYYKLYDYVAMVWMSATIQGGSHVEKFYNFDRTAIFIMCSTFGLMRVIDFTDEIGYFTCHPTCMTCHSTSKSEKDCRTCGLGSDL